MPGFARLAGASADTNVLFVSALIPHIDDFSSGAVCLAVVSDFFDESDYYRTYEEFLSTVRGER